MSIAACYDPLASSTTQRLEQIKAHVDNEDPTITLDEIAKALGTLDKAESQPFPVVPTIVK